MGRGNESLIAKSRSHDQDGRHAHIWYQTEILCGVSMGRGNESLIAKSRSHDQDGHHAHIW